MEDAGLSVPGLAGRSRVDASIVEAILSGDHPVRPEELRRLAAALGVRQEGCCVRLDHLSGRQLLADVSSPGSRLVPGVW